MPTAREEIEALLEQIRARAGDAAMVRLADQVSVLCRGHMSAVPGMGWARFGLSRLEARLMAALVEKIGRCVGKSALMDALYFYRAGVEPEPKILDIMICRIRKKIAGSGYAIETLWGHGYRARFDGLPPCQGLAEDAVQAA